MIASPTEPAHDRAVGVMAIAIFAALSVWGAVASPGFLEADAGTHYLYARFAIAEPHYLTNVWGRPLCTGVYALPAHYFGRIGVRLTSLLLAIGCAIVAWKIARELRWSRPVLAGIFTLAQPLVFLHSFSELTELPFALVIGLAFWAYVKKQWLLMSLLVGLSPLGRPEGFGFVLLAIGALLLHRRAWWIPALLVPLALWNHAGWVIFGRDGPWWGWLASQWPYAQTSLYPSGSVFHFVALLPVVTSPLLLPGTLLGVGLCVVRGRDVFRYFDKRRARVSAAKPQAGGLVSGNSATSLDVHRDLCTVLVALLPAGILAVHSMLYFLGKMASNGELRYLLVVAPLWGMLSAAGWGWVFHRLQWRGVMLWALVASIVPLTVNAYYRTVPIAYEHSWNEARQMVDWYRSSPRRITHPFFSASHTGVYYFLDVSPSDRAKVRLWEQQTVQTVPPGTMLFWDETFALMNADANRTVSIDDLESAGWKRVEDPEMPDLPTWRVYVSPEIQTDR